MLFKTRDIFIFAIIAAILVSLVLLALPWPRKRQRWLIAGVATFIGWIAWNLLLNETDAVGGVGESSGWYGDRSRSGRLRLRHLCTLSERNNL